MKSALLWLEQTGVSVWIRESPSLLAFPFILFLHTLGLAMLAGISVALSVWLLRAKSLVRPAQMTGVFRVMWLGFAINALSGIALLIAYPAKALTNPLFYAKLGLVLLGVYAVARVNRQILAGPQWGAGATVTARRWAVVSIIIWLGTILAGRLLAYTHQVLYADELP